MSDSLYRSYAYRIYPGPLSHAAEQALTGFRVTIRPASPGTIEVVVFNIRTDTLQRVIYDASDQLYIVDREMDDEATGEETDDTDDWFLLTDAAGHIIASGGP